MLSRNIILLVSTGKENMLPAIRILQCNIFLNLQEKDLFLPCIGMASIFWIVVAIVIEMKQYHGYRGQLIAEAEMLHNCFGRCRNKNVKQR